MPFHTDWARQPAVSHQSASFNCEIRSRIVAFHRLARTSDKNLSLSSMVLDNAFAPGGLIRRSGHYFTQSNPDIIFRGPLPSLVPRIDHSPRLDQQQMHFAFRVGLVL